MNGSYNLNNFSTNKDLEIQRLKFQVDLFFDKEFKKYLEIGLKDGMTILDCGAGPGFLIMKILEKLPNCKASALEVDSYLFDVLQKNSNNNGEKIFTANQADIYNTKFPDKSFDIIISRLVFEHLIDPEKALKELKRILKDNGKIIIISNDFSYHLLTYPVIEELDDLYNAYCSARFKENGNPLIARELPYLFKKLNFINLDFDCFCVHSQITGDNLFLKSENVNISNSLIQEGFLDKNKFNKLSGKWVKNLGRDDHAFLRQLFIISGQKSDKAASGINTSVKKENKKPELNISAVKTINDEEKISFLLKYINTWLVYLLDDESIKVSLDDYLINLGCESIAAVELSNQIISDFKVQLEVYEILGKNTVKTLIMKILENINLEHNSQNNTTLKNVVSDEGEL